MEKNEETQPKKQPKQKSKKKLVGFIVLLCGIMVCVAGLVFLLVNLFTGPGLRDAEYLVKVGQWVREDEPNVIWNFTEIGKGSLTSNNHTNDYEFIWELDEETLKVETSWLYNLNNEYSYEIEDGRLILNDTITFVPAEQST